MAISSVDMASSHDAPQAMLTRRNRAISNFNGSLLAKTNYSRYQRGQFSSQKALHGSRVPLHKSHILSSRSFWTRMDQSRAPLRNGAHSWEGFTQLSTPATITVFVSGSHHPQFLLTQICMQHYLVYCSLLSCAVVVLLHNRSRPA